MSFVHWGFLGALAALAIPIALHLLFRGRSRSIDLGTLQFLQVVLRENSRRRKLKRLALLALRLACVALLALLFARPFLLASEPGGDDRLVVVLVDRSASMGLDGAGPLGRAVAEARAIAARAGAGARLEVAAYDREPRSVDPAELEAVPTAAGTDHGAALVWARDLAVRSRAVRKEVHILTDLQRSGLGRSMPAPMPPDVAVHVADLGRPFPRNVAVASVRVEPASPARPGAKLRVRATVRNASPLPVAGVPVRLRLESEGRRVELDRAADLEGGASAVVEFETPALDGGLWAGRVEAAAEGDELAFDDARHFAADVAPPPVVLVVDGDPGRSPFEAETYFLQAALRLAPPGERFEGSPFEVRASDMEDGHAPLPDLAGVSAVVLANVPDLDAADARRLAEFVRAGGGLLVFAGDRLEGGSAANLRANGLDAGAIRGAESAGAVAFRLEGADAEHPVFRPFADPERGDLRRPAFARAARIEPAEDARVLASFRGGPPALIERAVGRGRVLWFASTCSRDWGDWPRGRLFLPLVHRLAAHAAGVADGGRVREVVAGPDDAPGVAEADGLVRVVNPDPAESDPARVTPAEFAERLGFRLAEAPTAPDESADGPGPSDDRLRGDEIWPWLALALVGALLVENFLANRTSA